MTIIEGEVSYIESQIDREYERVCGIAETPRENLERFRLTPIYDLLAQRKAVATSLISFQTFPDEKTEIRRYFLCIEEQLKRFFRLP